MNNLFLDDDDDDIFGANPFRSSSDVNTGMVLPPQQQLQQQLASFNDPFGDIHNQQPDPNSGMIGAFPEPQPQQQQQPMSQPWNGMNQQPSNMTSHPQSHWHQQRQQQQHQQHQQQAQQSPSYALSGTMDNQFAAQPPHNTAYPSTNHGSGTGGGYGSDGVTPRQWNATAATSMVIPPNTPWYSWRRCFSCTRIDAWAMYFDVDTVHIQYRLFSAVTKFYERDVFRTGVLGETKPIGPLGPPVSALPISTPSSFELPDSSSLPEPDDAMATLRTGPDLYGPLWIATTLVFLMGVTTNLSDYFRHVQHVHHNAAKAASSTTTNTTSTSGDGNTTIIIINNTTPQEEEFEYDLRHLQRATTVIFVFVIGIPTFFWFVSTCCLQMNGMPSTTSTPASISTVVPSLTWVMWVCLYGYSLTPFLLATTIAWLPIMLVQWIVLAVATSISGLLVIRNLSTPLLAHASGGIQRAEGLILAMLGCHFIFMCVLKFGFYSE
jgi:hypothetical protein